MVPTPAMKSSNHHERVHLRRHSPTPIKTTPATAATSPPCWYSFNGAEWLPSWLLKPFGTNGSKAPNVVALSGVVKNLSLT